MHAIAQEQWFIKLCILFENYRMPFQHLNKTPTVGLQHGLFPKQMRDLGAVCEEKYFRETQILEGKLEPQVLISGLYRAGKYQLIY